jgi:hypothetical protein
MNAYDPQRFAEVSSGQEFSVATRVGVAADLLATWDGDLLREPRVCVPIDVQALVVPRTAPAGTEAVALTGPLSPGSGAGEFGGGTDPGPAHDVLTGPAPFTDASPRAAGVHLHWALPDALLRGVLADPTPASEEPSADTTGPSPRGGGLRMAALPDRWLVLRLLAPTAPPPDGDSPGLAVGRGWVLDASTGRSWDLPAWTGEVTDPGGVPEMPAVPAEGLTGTAGGTLTWTAGYDAAARRFAFHDPLDDLAADPTLGGTLPGGPEAERATYLVVGWWSREELDPLDEVRGTAGLDRRLAELGWGLRPRCGTPQPPPPVAVADDGAGHGALALDDLGLRVAGAYRGAVHDAVFTPGLLAGGVTEGVRHIPPPRPPRPEAATLLHGCVVGVPVTGDVEGRVVAAELRPPPDAPQTGLGEHLFDALGALTAHRTAARLGITGDAEVGVVERLVAAFARHELHLLADPAGAAQIDAGLHAAGFTSVETGAAAAQDRLVDGRFPATPQGRRIGTVPPVRGTATGAAEGTRVVFGPGAARYRASLFLRAGTADTLAAATLAGERVTGDVPGGVPGDGGFPTAATPAPRTRVQERPAPPRWVPNDPYLAVVGAGRSLRHGGDGRWTSEGVLQVRHPSQLDLDLPGALRGTQILASLASGAVPAEAGDLAREALHLSPHLQSWLARRAAAVSRGTGGSTDHFRSRFAAEHLLRYDASGAYSTRAGLTASSEPVLDAPWRPGDPDPDAAVAALALRDHSLWAGVDPSPVGVTAWAQPWAPVWLEYELEVRGGDLDSAADWTLGQTDLGPREGTDPGLTEPVAVVIARVPLSTGTATALGEGVAAYLADETRRDRQGQGEVDDTTQARLARLAEVAGSPDLLGATLDGVRRVLLGLPARAVLAKDPTGTPVRPTPGPAHLFTAGEVRLLRARVLDTFGRVLDLDPARATVPRRLSATPAFTPSQGRMLRPPRLSVPARVRLRLVDAASRRPEGAAEASVDEADPGAAVTPVSGFLLPDHVDESLEVFDTRGTALGELLVTGQGGPDGGGVVWEPAPGRAVPVDAAPAEGLATAQLPLAAFAAGLVAADALARQGGRRRAGEESALSALLRAVDTTLWTVDTVAAAGSAGLAAIVGSPVAVVRAVLELDVAEDLDALTLDAEGRAERATRYADLTRVGVTVRLGEITRPDDGLLAWFLDDDFGHARLVDRVVAELAREAGRGRGHLVAWGQTPQDPPVEAITHPYVVADDEVELRLGVPRMVTLLMAPGAAVHVTSGITPRSATRLQRSWFADGLDRLVPSVRVGPVLVDPGDVRLPLVAALGEQQTLTTREGPLGWRDDAILAASSSALLPDRATVLREGWVRVTPSPGGEP